MGPVAHFNPRPQTAVGSIESVYFAVIPARKPKCLAIVGYAAHIRAPDAWNLPFGRNFPRAQVKERYASLAAVRDVEILRITAKVETMRSLTCWNEIYLLE